MRCLIGAALFSLNERDAFAQHMEIARSLAERLGNEERLVRGLANQTNALWFSGELPRARETGERALALAQSKGLREHRIHAGVNLGIVLQSAGDARKAIDLFAGVISLLQGDLERQRLGRTLYPASFARNELAACRAELGDSTVHSRRFTRPSGSPSPSTILRPCSPLDSGKASSSRGEATTPPRSPPSKPRWRA